MNWARHAPLRFRIAADGKTTSHGETKQVCDANGGNCTEKSDGQVDPEQDNSMVTQEMVDGTLRMRGAAVNVVAGWNAPGVEENPTDPRNPGTIMLVDDTVGDVYMLLEPKRVTAEAEPESYPDLPSPMNGTPANRRRLLGPLLTPATG